MADTHLEYSREAAKMLSKMPRTTRDLIRAKMAQYAAAPETLSNNVTKLQGFEQRYRLRVGDWRVIFDQRDGVILVAKVAPRGSAYE